jgi:hypothetical protein
VASGGEPSEAWGRAAASLSLCMSPSVSLCTWRPSTHLPLQKLGISYEEINNLSIKKYKLQRRKKSILLLSIIHFVHLTP